MCIFFKILEKDVCFVVVEVIVLGRAFGEVAADRLLIYVLGTSVDVFLRLCSLRQLRCIFVFSNLFALRWYFGWFASLVLSKNGFKVLRWLMKLWSWRKGWCENVQRLALLHWYDIVIICAHLSCQWLSLFLLICAQLGQISMGFFICSHFWNCTNLWASLNEGPFTAIDNRLPRYPLHIWACHGYLQYWLVSHFLEQSDIKTVVNQG